MQNRYLNLAAALLFAAATSVHAVAFTESGDAGQLSGTAQSVGAGFDGISGAIAPLGDIDVFRLELGAGLFTATVTSSAFDLDSALVLFDAAGRGLRADDDSGGGINNAQVSATLTAGVYYLAVFSILDYLTPTSAGGNLWNNVISDANTAPDGPGAASPWTGWQPDLLPFTDSGNYTITFNQTTAAAAVPEPGTLALTGLGLAGLRLRRRR